AGNLHSLVKAISTDERTISIETDLRAAMTADLLVLPGVGAFGAAADAMQNSQSYLAAALVDGLPCLGICLGMQLLFDASEESPGNGIGFIPGNVTRLRTSKVPHMGWNDIDWRETREVGSQTGNGRAAPTLDTAYFANAYICEPEVDLPILAWTTHENAKFASVVRSVNTVGVQFHPEKSSGTGRAFLNAVIEDLIECR
ncbi:MAG TPA: imidazole glycerol phosphate synthase subunit HisH, partial [Gemmatimonadaceae bacterium]|nr:imidazole glycerol phosphate synthase subunit HisH [Gemmatimonadaceae bacterium]